MFIVMTLETLCPALTSETFLWCEQIVASHAFRNKLSQTERKAWLLFLCLCYVLLVYVLDY